MPKATKVELAWLGGIIDGEGSIGVFSDRKRSGYHQVRFGIVNTDDGIIKECCRILGKLDIFYLVHKKTAKVNRDCFIIEINRINECKEVGKIIRPFIESRQKQKKLIELELHIKRRIGRSGKPLNCRPKQNTAKNQLTLLEGGG